MKPTSIFSWNVNGLRSAYKKGLMLWLVENAPDILCLQEIKVKEDQLPTDLIQLKGYYTIWNSADKPGYSGTAIFTKEKPLHVELGIGIKDCETEGRVIIAYFSNFIIINCYVPNGRPDHSRVRLKLKFYQALLEKSISLLSEGKNVLICGDWNVAHQEIDLCNPKGNRNKTGFLENERSCIDTFIKYKFLDIFRYFYPNSEGQYTWWSPSHNAKERNAGWRFDYIFTNSEFIKHIEKIKIHKEVTFSDHCPISITLSNNTFR